MENKRHLSPDNAVPLNSAEVCSIVFVLQPQPYWFDPVSRFQCRQFFFVCFFLQQKNAQLEMADTVLATSWRTYWSVYQRQIFHKSWLVNFGLAFARCAQISANVYPCLLDVQFSKRLLTI